MFMGMVFQKSGRFFQTVFWNIYGGIDVGGVARFVMGGRGPEHLANGYCVRGNALRYTTLGLRSGAMGLRYANPRLYSGAPSGH